MEVTGREERSSNEFKEGRERMGGRKVLGRQRPD